MVSLPLLRRAGVTLIVAAIGALYLADLTGMGMYGPDEPRYADIGRAMARTGDFITPRLWGQPWFEKPPLLYWMTAAGFRAGLGPDLAPRLPVAILSLLFLVFFWWRLRAEWGPRVAVWATIMLATSGGWLAYSHVGVTDVPMSVFFSCAWLLALPWVSRKDSSGIPAAAGCLGLAVLAKALVPLVLFVPVLALPLFSSGRASLRAWVAPRALMVFLAVAAPWYVLCTIRNGSEFLRVLFIEQQFGRMTSNALQHVQPWWFYAPVLLVLLFPWFPVLFSLPAGLAAHGNRAEDENDPRIRTLAAIVIWGLVFFSVAINKLYGYLLPLLPALFTLFAVALARLKKPARAFIVPLQLSSLLLFAPAIASRALGAHKMTAADVPWLGVGVALCAAAVVGEILARRKPAWCLPAAALIAAGGLLGFQYAAFPALDRSVSARPLWLSDHPSCAPAAPRNTLYGLYYYSGRQLPPCTVLDPDRTRGVR